DRAVADDEVMAEPVELAGGGAGAHLRADEIERGRGQMPGPAHALEFARVVQLYLPRPAAPAVGYFGNLHRSGWLVSGSGPLGSDWTRLRQGGRRSAQGVAAAARTRCTAASESGISTPLRSCAS